MAPAAALPDYRSGRGAQWALMSGGVVAVASAVGGNPFAAQAWMTWGLAAAAWIWAASGYGRLLVGILCPKLAADDLRRTPLAIGLGLAVSMAVANFTASCGWLPSNTWTRILMWAVLATGWLFSGVSVRSISKIFNLREAATEPLLWCAVPALTSLMLVTALPPGLAWSTEFGGYDALSYHLELPKLWLESGRLAPLPGNIYSAFPSFVEGVSLQLFALSSNPSAAHSCALLPQMFHALLAVCTAWVVATLAVSLNGEQERTQSQTIGERLRLQSWTRAIGWCGFLGIPWVIVTASLAYTEMAVLLFMATAMLAWTVRESTTPIRMGAVLGLLLAAAVGAKLVAAVMVVIPVLVWALLVPNAWKKWRGLLITVVVGGAVGIVVLLPWLMRNHAATGSWTFPFVLPGISADAGAARNGWWTAEQIARFAAGHTAPGDFTLMTRMQALWNAAWIEGFGPAPDADPWLPQWSVAFWIGSACMLWLLRRAWRETLPLAVLLILQLGFWMFATHLKSRFLLPAAIPLVLATALACAPILTERGATAVRTRGTLFLKWAAITGLVLWCVQPVVLRRLDTRTAVALALCAEFGSESMNFGRGTREGAKQSASEGVPMPLAWIANWLLPPNAVLGSEGEADCFWIVTPPVVGSVWDGGPLARVLRVHGDDIDAAVQALSESEHLTHLAIGESMLARWSDAGWIDPALTPARVRAVAEKLVPVARTAAGGRVFLVPQVAHGVNAPAKAFDK